MVEIMAHFSGEANRACCLAHVINLVVKIILHQFDMLKKKKKKNLPNKTDTAGDANKAKEDEDPDDFDEQEELILEKEEKEMEEGDDDDDVKEDSTSLSRDVEIMEAAMEDEIEKVVRNVKPAHQVLYKVIILLLFYLLFPFQLTSVALRVRRVFYFYFGLSTLSTPFCCSPSQSHFLFYFGLSALSTPLFSLRIHRVLRVSHVLLFYFIYACPP